MSIKAAWFALFRETSSGEHFIAGCQLAYLPAISRTPQFHSL
jgi:hypothetical protein